MKLLDGKVVIVTGAGRGVGRGHALTLAEQGARVVVNDPGKGVHGESATAASRPADEVAALIRQRGGDAVANYDDISTWAGAKHLVEQAVDHFKTLDGLVNNAGVLIDGDISDVTEADFDIVMGVHSKGTFACMRHACEYWRGKHRAGERVRASIVNTVSDALFFALPGSVYGAAKAAIAHYTLVGSIEGAKYGVRMNATAPRAFTRMSMASSMMVYPDGVVPKQAEEYTEDSPVNPANSSPIVAWLLSDEASHVTGQIFRTLAGAFAQCEPWRPTELCWPADGAIRFKPEDVGAAMNKKVFRSQFEGRPLDFAPGDSRSQKTK